MWRKLAKQVGTEEGFLCVLTTFFLSENAIPLIYYVLNSDANQSSPQAFET